MLKVGITGAGFMGSTHAQAYKLLSDVELVAIADIDEQKRRKFIDTFNTNGYGTLDEMLDFENLDIVDVCLPTFLHKDAAIKAAQAGINIICEKPMALNLQDADEMIQATQNVKFMVAQVLRFWPDYQVIKQILDSGKLGTILLITASRLSPPPNWAWQDWLLKPELSGGAVVDLHIHDLDFIAWLLGPPKYIFATAVKSPTGALDTVFTNGFEHQKGGVSFAEGSLAMPPNYPFTMSMKVLCEDGCLQFCSRNEKPITVFPIGEEPYQPQIPSPVPPELQQMPEAIGNVQALGGYFVEIEYFVNCVKENKKPEIVTPQDARLALQLSLAARQSAQTAKVVEIR